MLYRAVAVLGWLAVVASQASAEDVTYSLHGSGTTNPSKYFWKLMDMMEEQAKVPLYMTYRAVGSSTGQYEFIGIENGLEAYNHFGAGDIPVTQTYYDQLTATGAEMVHVPFALGAISIFHSAPDVPAGGLKLDACLLSKIFQRRIKTWDHVDILAQNPGFAPPSGQNINVVHRDAGSSSTAGTTEYLKTANAGAADAMCQWDQTTGSKSNWAEDTVARQGSDGVTQEILATEWSIGYIDAGHGHSFGLQEIELKNKDGVYLSTKEATIGDAAAEAINAGVLPTSGTESWATVNLYNQAGAKTWPITMMSYFYIRKDLSSLGASGSLLKAFVEYVLSDAGQKTATEFMFWELPNEVRELNEATMASLQLDAAAPVWGLETATDKGGGAGKFVLSGKRRAYAEYERSLFEKEIVSLHGIIATLQTTLALQHTELARIEGEVAQGMGSLITENTRLAKLVADLEAKVDSYHIDEEEHYEEYKSVVSLENEIMGMKADMSAIKESQSAAPADGSAAREGMTVVLSKDDDSSDTAMAVAITAIVVGALAAVLSVYNMVQSSKAPASCLSPNPKGHVEMSDT